LLAFLPKDLNYACPFSLSTDFISFHKISAAELMRDVKPSGLVPDDRIMTALAFQVRGS
jgi:hypothetical protein